MLLALAAAGMAWFLAARRHPRRIVAGLLGLATLPFLGLGIWAWRTAATVDLFRLRPDAPVLYAASQVIRPGLSVEAADLMGTFRRLRYAETTTAPTRPGEVRRGARRWDVFLRARDDPGATRPSLRVQLVVAEGRVTAIATAEQSQLAEIELEPEVLSGLGDRALTRLRRDRVGFVFQSFNLLPTLTAEQNIRLPLELAGRAPDPAWWDTVIAATGRCRSSGSPARGR